MIARRLRLGAVLALAFGCLALGGTAHAVELAYAGTTSPGSVVALDTRTNTVVARIAVGVQNGNDAIVTSVSKDGARVYATSNALKTLSVIDTAGLAVIATVPLPGTPVDVVASPDGKRVYISTGDGKVLFFDTATGSVIGAIILGSSSLGHMAITPDSSKLYVQSAITTVTVINTVAGAVATSLTVESNGGAPMSVSPDGKKLYIGSLLASRATVIDTATNVVSLLNTPVFPTSIGFSPDGSRLLITLANPVLQNGIVVLDGNLLILNATTLEAIQTYHVGMLPTAVATSADGVRAYVVNGGVGNMSVIDLVAQKFLATTVLGPNVTASNSMIANAPAPGLLVSVLPQVRTTVPGSPASGYATVINNTATTATNCRMTLVVDPFAPLKLEYVSTTPEGHPVGHVGDPFTLAPGGQKTIIFGLTPQNAASPFSGRPDLRFTCDGLQAPLYPGVADFIINVEANRGPDIIPIAVTLSGDGVVRIATHNGSQVMATAALNTSANQGPVTVKPVVFGGPIPAALSIYETDAAGQPLGQPAASITTNFAPGTPRYFGVIATATGTIPLQADAVRVVLQFTDGAGTVRGQTSVAIVAP